MSAGLFSSKLEIAAFSSLFGVLVSMLGPLEWVLAFAIGILLAWRRVAELFAKNAPAGWHRVALLGFLVGNLPFWTRVGIYFESPLLIVLLPCVPVILMAAGREFELRTRFLAKRIKEAS